MLGLLLLSLFASDAQAAACCGGTSAAPALISGDDAYQFSFIASRAEVIGDAPASGRPIFRGPGSDEVTETYRLEGVALVSDRWQASAALPLVRKSRATGDASLGRSGVGDISLGAGFEAWPEWDYSEWKPRGFLFAQLNLPVASSIYDSTNTAATDAFGTGFYRVSVGSLLTKTWRDWDASVVPEFHASFARSFQDASGNEMRVHPGPGASTELSGGYHFSRIPLRLGLRFQPVWNASRTIEIDGGQTRSSDQWVWNAGLDLTYSINPEWSAGAAYTDQTLFGPAINTTLSRVFALNFQRRWPR